MQEKDEIQKLKQEMMLLKVENQYLKNRLQNIQDLIHPPNPPSPSPSPTSPQAQTSALTKLLEQRFLSTSSELLTGYSICSRLWLSLQSLQSRIQGKSSPLSLKLKKVLSEFQGDLRKIAHIYFDIVDLLLRTSSISQNELGRLRKDILYPCHDFSNLMKEVDVVEKFNKEISAFLATRISQLNEVVKMLPGKQNLSELLDQIQILQEDERKLEVLMSTAKSDAETKIQGYEVDIENFRIKIQEAQQLRPQPIATIEQAIQQGRCTFEVSSRAYPYQAFYNCETCGLVRQPDNVVLGCCASCVNTCHHGHNVTLYSSNTTCFCDCGAGDCIIACTLQYIDPTPNLEAMITQKEGAIRIIKAELEQKIQQYITKKNALENTSRSLDQLRNITGVENAEEIRELVTDTLDFMPQAAQSMTHVIMIRSEIEALWGMFSQSFCTVDFPNYLLTVKRLKKSIIDIIINNWKITGPSACIKLITDGNELEALMQKESLSTFDRTCIRNIFKGSSDLQNKFLDWIQPYQKNNEIFFESVCSNTLLYIEPVKVHQKKYLCF